MFGDDVMKIIKIGAVWCPGCLVMNKIWNKISKDNSLEIISLDYDMDSDDVRKYEVGKILPVIIFLDKNDCELDRLIGEQSENKILELIDKYRGM